MKHRMGPTLSRKSLNFFDGKCDDKRKSSFLGQNTEFPTLSFDNWAIIAGHLSLRDLMILADVCTNARQAARLVFTRKYASTRFHLAIDNSYVKIWTMYFAFDEQNAQCLKFLRIFGYLITEFYFCCRCNRHFNRLQQFIKHLNQFTAQSRKTIQFTDAYGWSVTEFKALVTECKNVSSLEFLSKRGLIFLKQNLPRVTKLLIVDYWTVVDQKMCRRYCNAIQSSDSGAENRPIYQINFERHGNGLGHLS